MTAPTRIAVLASGRGSNLQAILDAIAAGRLRAEVVGVFSDRPAAAALQRVSANLRWAHAPKEFQDRAAYEQALGDALAAVAPDWIVCAGYMRILGAAFVQRFNGRLVNIHPSLLPLHKGLDTHARALDAGDAEHGASVHLVVPELDAGAVLAQVRVRIFCAETIRTPFFAPPAICSSPAPHSPMSWTFTSSWLPDQPRIFPYYFMPGD